MKTVSVEQFRANVDQYLADAERENLVLTRGDKPCMLLQGIANQPDSDREGFVGSAEFWQVIRERRKELPIPWGEAKQSIGLQ
jgi:antitoxin (DNA-binding transcriptional repressor) of toxin-antitoxin stability system